MADVYEKVVEIIEDIADIPREEISADSELIDDLDLASLEIVSIISKLEKAFSIKMSEKELLAIETVNDLVELISASMK